MSAVKFRTEPASLCLPPRHDLCDGAEGAQIALRAFGGVTAAVLWEITRRVLVWYFSTLSKVNVVYGSLTTAIVVLFSLEIAATLLLFGAQVIAEYEKFDRQVAEKASKPATN